MKEYNITNLTEEQIEALRGKVETRTIIGINIESKYDNEHEVSTLIISPIEETEETKEDWRPRYLLQDALKVLLGTDADNRQDYTFSQRTDAFEVEIPKSLCYPHAIADRVIPALLICANNMAVDYWLSMGENCIYMGVVGYNKEQLLVLEAQDMYGQVDWSSIEVQSVIQALGAKWGKIYYNIFPNKLQIGVDIKGQHEIERFLHVATLLFNENLIKK